ncbi:MAG: DUF523 domain-containing protein [Sandaracinus sp.]|nr:DUF523 domain-containing protein [Sandaracinus sp.]
MSRPLALRRRRHRQRPRRRPRRLRPCRRRARSPRALLSGGPPPRHAANHARPSRRRRVDVLRGRARVRDEKGADLTAPMVEGAHAMVELATREQVDFAILTDASGACGSQVVSLGCRFDSPRRHQRGVGVATAALLEAGVDVVSQRDFRTLGRLIARLDPEHVVPSDARDHHEHPWVLENLPGTHPRA